MTTNSVALTPGEWELSGGISASGGAFDFIALQWASANGDDTTAIPAYIEFSLAGGNSVQASSVPPTSGVYVTASNNPGTDFKADLATFIRLNIIANQTIYLLATVNSASGTDTDVTVSIYASKL